MAGPRTTRGAAEEARFGAWLPDAIAGTGVERDFCDRGDIGADVTVTGLAVRGVGLTTGTCAGVFSVEGGEGLLGDAIYATFAVGDGAEDGLFTGGTAGCGSSDTANREI